MTDPNTPNDDTPASAEDRAADRLTMDYPAEILQQPTGAGTVRGRPGMKPVRREEDPEADDNAEEQRP
jgi:hypothetical protein